jgi:hypothetical protein
MTRDGRPPPRKTRFLAAGPVLPDGIGYPQGFNERFHILEMILLSRASWRNVSLRLRPALPGGGFWSFHDPAMIGRHAGGLSEDFGEIANRGFIIYT